MIRLCWIHPKMPATFSTETLITFYQTTRPYIPEDAIFTVTAMRTWNHAHFKHCVSSTEIISFHWSFWRHLVAMTTEIYFLLLFPLETSRDPDRLNWVWMWCPLVWFDDSAPNIQGKLRVRSKSSALSTLKLNQGMIWLHYSTEAKGIYRE
jgi:CDP-diglyceride synthetase